MAKATKKKEVEVVPVIGSRLKGAPVDSQESQEEPTFASEGKLTLRDENVILKAQLGEQQALIERLYAEKSTQEKRFTDMQNYYLGRMDHVLQTVDNAAKNVSLTLKGDL